MNTKNIKATLIHYLLLLGLCFGVIIGALALTRRGSLSQSVKAAMANDTVNVTVNNIPPTVGIKPPTQGLTLYAGPVYVFEGNSYDPDGGLGGSTLPCLSLKWTSSNPGDFVQQQGCTSQASFPTIGTRTITLTGTDSGNLSGTAMVTINVVNAPPGGPPVATILTPRNNYGLDAYSFASLKGTAYDPDHQSPLTYKWVVRDGSTLTTLFMGMMNDKSTITNFWKPANNLFFNCGGRKVRLFLYVTDPDNKTGLDYVDVYIFFPVC